MSSRDHLLAAMSHPIISGVDAEDEVEAEAYMRSGLMALQLMSTPPTREGTPDGKRRKKVAWAGDEEEEVVVVEKEVEKVEEQKVLVDDCIDEDGHVWLLHLRERARDAIRSGVRKEDMALFVSIPCVTISLKSMSDLFLSPLSLFTSLTLHRNTIELLSIHQLKKNEHAVFLIGIVEYARTRMTRLLGGRRISKRDWECPKRSLGIGIQEMKVVLGMLG